MSDETDRGMSVYVAALERLDAWVAEVPDDRAATLYCYGGACMCCVDREGRRRYFGAGPTFAEAITRALDAADAAARKEAANV